MLIACIVLCAYTGLFVFVTGIFELTHCVWVIIINVNFSVYWQDTYIYIYIYIHTHTHARAHTHAHTYIYICLFIYVFLLVCVVLVKSKSVHINYYSLSTVHSTDVSPILISIH